MRLRIKILRIPWTAKIEQEREKERECVCERDTERDIKRE